MSTWSAPEVLELARRYMESRILLTAAELNLFDLLKGEPQSVEQVARALDGDERALRIVLDALVAMELLVKAGDRYNCAPNVAGLLSPGDEGSVLPMVLHMNYLWRKWSAMTDIAKGRSPVSELQEFDDDDGRLRAFIGAMHVVASPTADAIAKSVDASDATHMLDVGAGPGTYAMAFLHAYPSLHVTLFDRPDVIEMARERVDAAGYGDRVTYTRGDFYSDDLPAGHDLALLSAIIHQNSDEQNIALYRKVYDALLPGGRIVIRDHVMSPDRTEPRAGAIFAVNMLAATEGGDCYTLDEIRSGLETAGFAKVALTQTGERMDCLVGAFKPE